MKTHKDAEKDEELKSLENEINRIQEVLNHEIKENEELKAAMVEVEMLKKKCDVLQLLIDEAQAPGSPDYALPSPFLAPDDPERLKMEILYLRRLLEKKQAENEDTKEEINQLNLATSLKITATSSAQDATKASKYDELISAVSDVPVESVPVLVRSVSEII